MRGNQAIVLDLSCGNLTKAISAEDLNSVEAEGYVKHVDVLIFGEQVQQSGQSDAATVFHQRIQWSEAFFVDGTATLNAKRNQFVANQDYKVYVIANSTYPSTAFAAIDEESDLYQLVQTDANLHLTGLASSDESTDEDTTPDFFLMEGRAYTSGTSAVLNDGNAAHSTVLEAGLARAVSKVVVELTAGAKVQFSDPAQSVYHYRNLPYSTVTVPETGYEISPALKSTDAQPINGYVQWQKSVAAAEGVEAVTGKITVTGYVYSYSWTALDKETSLIVNIPMTHIEGETTTTYPSNYYKIPLSKDRKFERNHYYKVSAVVNAPGSESNFDPITLEDLKYDTFPWVDILPPIQVGNEINKPKYLQLNTYHVDMYNINEDNTTLEFSSSSYITEIELIDAYYFNKYGVQTDVPANIQTAISAIAEAGVLNGNISIFSPIVSTTEGERNTMKEELLDQFGGTAPSAPSTTKPVDPEQTPPDPAEIANKHSINNWVTVTYSGTGANVIFTDNNRISEASDEAQEEYNALYEAYRVWGDLTDAQKEAAKAEYNAALEAYNNEAAAYIEYQAKLAGIEATANPSHYNTVRYLTFRVTNAQNMTAEFTVTQYPVIYITNSLGWYSYRKDFRNSETTNPTTFQNKGDRIVGISLNWNSGWDDSETSVGDYSYSTERNSGFWYSKVRISTNTTGTDYIAGYSWNSNASSPTSGSSNSSNNARAYFINVTATSSSYVVARPRMKTDPISGLTVTDWDPVNQNLVSPSFMIASRLGTFTTNGGNINYASDDQRLQIFREHCANYVEVHGDASNPIIYDNWRLPTRAELQIIMNHQGESGENAAAIDYLLNAGFYFGAAGPVYNNKNNQGVDEDETGTTSKSVRCIRDVY